MSSRWQATFRHVASGMWKVLVAVVLASLLFGIPGQWISIARAWYGEPPPTPDRKTTVKIDVDLYEWWLTRWNSNQTLCRVIIDHTDLPNGQEIYYSCGEKIFDEWRLTQPCNLTDPEKGFEQCPGVYLYLAGQGRGQRLVKISLPAPTVTLSIAGCDLQPPENRCTSQPRLKITGVEPLPNESIIRLMGNIGTKSFSCPGSSCEIPMEPTSDKGVLMEFWADSSFGDSSPHYTAQIRAVPWGDFMAPEGVRQKSQVWFVDVLSSQWRGPHMASCADTWQVFPELGGPPTWLTTPRDPNQLQSSISYYYLAGMLIQNTGVDASKCPGGGLQPDNTANTCGVEAALPKVKEWQNRFDSEILGVSRDTGVPAQLLKNIFGRESQLWPGIYNNYQEAGLGQLTEKGADTVLLWNPQFFEKFCPLVLSKETCLLGFGNLPDDQQNMLRGALVKTVNNSCPTCPERVDLSQVNFSVRVFAETLAANCEQAGRIITNTTQHLPGDISSYADLWKFTLVNYNAGPGCLADAVQKSWNLSSKLNWANVSANLSEVCQASVDYVDTVSQTVASLPTPTPWFVPGTLQPETPTAPVPTLDPTLLITATPQTPTPTPSQTPTVGLPGGNAVLKPTLASTRAPPVALNP